jgi:recombinational DNA repair protein (RecF pathway)
MDPDKIEGIILQLDEHGERFLKLTAFSRRDGLRTFLLRKSKRSSETRPDIFDHAEWQSERTKEQQALFLRSYSLIHRRQTLSQNYQTLLWASRLARLFLKNGSHWQEPEQPFLLLERALENWEAQYHPPTVYLRALFLLSNGEGLPVREEWLGLLPPRLQPACRHALTSAWEKAADKDHNLLEEDLIPRFERWMESHHYSPWND